MKNDTACYHSNLLIFSLLQTLIPLTKTLVCATAKNQTNIVAIHSMFSGIIYINGSSWMFSFR